MSFLKGERVIYTINVDKANGKIKSVPVKIVGLPAIPPAKGPKGYRIILPNGTVRSARPDQLTKESK